MSKSSNTTRVSRYSRIKGGPVPAAALSRSVHEACFRLEYLCLNKCELPDWMEWQINRLYHFVSEVLQFENTINPTGRRNFQAQKNELGALLGKTPKRRGFPWRNLDGILSNISSGMPSGHDKRLRRLLFDYPSAFVHFGVVGAPGTGYSVEAARSSLLLSMELAMKLCRDEQLVPNELSTEVDAIATMCDQLRQLRQETTNCISPCYPHLTTPQTTPTSSVHVADIRRMYRGQSRDRFVPQITSGGQMTSCANRRCAWNY